MTGAAEGTAYACVMQCNRCGFCTSFCPTYLATGDEALSPRGRNQAYRAVLEGRIPHASEGDRLFSTCLLCGECTTVCFSEVPTAKIMGNARGKIFRQEGEPALLKFILRFILPRPRWMGYIFRAAFLMKKAGLSRLSNRMGLLGWISRELSAAEDMVDDVPWLFARERLKAPARSPGGPAPDVVFFLSCGSHYLRPSVAESTAYLLERLGVSYALADNVCCGLPGMTYGDFEAARRLAVINIDRFEKYPDSVILVDDSSCAATLKDYPSLFQEGTADHTRAVRLSGRVKDLSEFLKDQKWPDTSGAEPVTVTYHDPCKAQYAQKIVSPPRTVLSAFPSVELTELPESDQCCGGGGTYSFMHPDISREVLSRKTANIMSTGAEVVLTSAVSCLIQVDYGLRRARSGVRALHLSEFLKRLLDRPH